MAWEITAESSRSELLDGDNEMTPAFRQALEMWRAHRGDSALPEWRTACLLEFPRRLLSWAVVARYEPASGGFRVFYWGSSRTRLQRVDYTGRLVSEYQPPVIGAKVQREYTEVRNRAVPLLFRSVVDTPVQRGLEYYKIRLPYRDPGEEAANVVVSLDDDALMESRVYLAWQVDPSPAETR